MFGILSMLGSCPTLGKPEPIQTLSAFYLPGFSLVQIFLAI